MARKDINPFNIAFLDLLSGALAAVIILYIVVPKMTEEALLQLEEIELLDSLEVSVADIDSILQVLETSVPDTVLLPLQRRLDDLEDLTRALRMEIRDLHSDLDSMRQHMTASNRRIQDLEEQLRQAQAALLAERERNLGLFIESKQVVFVIDVSGSMNQDGINKLAEVASGIKMLIASMDDSYTLDIVFFPNESFGTVYGTFRGRLIPVTDPFKYEAYRFLSELQAGGSTPTEGAMRYVLDPSSYPQAGTVFLLSDGAPVNDQNEFLDRAALAGLVQRLTSLNGGRVAINTIGVGEEFRQIGGGSDAQYFLESLAGDNGGFYIGY